MNHRQDYVLFKARYEYEQRKKELNEHLDTLAEGKTTSRSWGQKHDKLCKALATDAVEYISVLQEEYSRAKDDVEMWKDKALNKQHETATTASSTVPQEKPL